MEQILNIPNPKFVFPNIEYESGEIKRVAREFMNINEEEFLSNFTKKAIQSELVPLSEEIWSNLENTDSFDIKYGDWELVNHHGVDGHPNRPRDWRNFKEKMQAGSEIMAPIICKDKERYHLVSGNTRLMVARALSIEPKVLIVDMS